MLRTSSSGSSAPGRAASARSQNSAAASAGSELAEQIDVLRGDLERRAARREHAQVGGRRDEEGHQLGHRFDDVLAVVEHDQARSLRQPLRDAAAEVGALLRRQRSLRADRVAHLEHGADLADDVLGRGDADELDDVHDRLGGVAREDVGEARLAEAARPDDRHHARVGQQRAQAGDVAVAAAQRARVVADAAADGAVERQQVAMRPAEALAGVGADPLEQVLPVGLVALERRPGPAHDGLAAQQVGEQRLVVGARGVRGLQRGQRLGVRAGAAGGLREDHAGGREIAGRRAADLGQRVGLVLARRAQPVLQPQGVAGQRGGALGVVVQRGDGVAHERGEPDAVDLGRVDPEPVADGVAHDRAGAERGPRARDQHLQALRPVHRRLVAPDEVDQPLAAYRPPAGGRQRRQQRLRTLPRDGGSPPAHVTEKGQGDGHGASLRAPYQGSRRGLPRMRWRPADATLRPPKPRRVAMSADDLIMELRLGWIRTVAFVVRDEDRWTQPLYELAVTTARRGWSVGITDARYWFITPEPEPLAAASAGLEPEGITFIGSTFADLRPGVVFLDPQGEVLEVDRVVTLSDVEATIAQDARSRTTASGALSVRSPR